MRRLSIARSLCLALVGLTLALATIAVLGISSLYSARQRYENILVDSSTLATDAANLEAAAIAEQEVLRDARGPRATAARRRAADAYLAAAAPAASLARSDPASARLVRAELAAEAGVRRRGALGGFPTAGASAGALASVRTPAAEIQARQQLRESAARSQARSDSRRAIVLIAIAGLLALAGALALILALVRGMSRPLDELVHATRGLAVGELERRVKPSGPRELQELGAAFNVMGEDLTGARRRIEDERRRLAATIESLGDALIVTEPGSMTIAAANPRRAATDSRAGGRREG